MRRYSALERLQRALYPFIRQNTLSDALLQSPAVEAGALDAALDVFARGGLFLEPNTVTVTAGSAVVTQVVPVGDTASNWTLRFRVGDEIVLGGSLVGQSGVYALTAVTALTVTVAAPLTTTETGLRYAKPTWRLLMDARDLQLLPNGFETDTQLRAMILAATATHTKRGSLQQSLDELAYITRRPVTPLESIPPTTPLGTGVAYTNSTQRLTSGTWSTGLAIGNAITVANSTLGSNGRYTVYDITGGIQLGTRAVGVRDYPTVRGTGGVEMQLHEDRERQRLFWRVVNESTSSVTVAASVTVTGGTATLLNCTPAPKTVTSAGGVFTTSGWTIAAGDTVEAILQLTTVTDATTFQVAITGGAIDDVRLGEACLSSQGTDEATVLTNLPPFRWGGIIRRGLPSAVNESTLTIYPYGRPGWFLEVTHPGQVENDAYIIASPDEYAVLEIDHRNTANYSEAQIQDATVAWLVPADTDVLLGMI